MFTDKFVFAVCIILERYFITLKPKEIAQSSHLLGYLINIYFIISWRKLSLMVAMDSKLES